MKLLAPWKEIFGRGVRLEAVAQKRFGMAPGSLRLAARTLSLADRTRTRFVFRKRKIACGKDDGP